MLPLSLLLLLPGVAQAFVPASTSTSPIWPSTNRTASLRASYTTDQGAGVVAGALSILDAGNASYTNVGDSSLGLLLYFNETLASDTNSTAASPVPFFALISCDRNVTVTTPNSTATNASSSASPTLNGTSTALNSTVSSGLGPNGVNITAVEQDVNVFELARAKNAVGAILYSNEGKACVLNEGYGMGNTLKSLPIYGLTSLDFNNFLLTQTSNLPSNSTHFNSTFLTTFFSPAALANFTASLRIPSGFLGANITQLSTNASQVSESSGGSPTYATVGHAPTSTPAPTGGSGALRSGGGVLGLMVLGGVALLL